MGPAAHASCQAESPATCSLLARLMAVLPSMWNGEFNAPFVAIGYRWDDHYRTHSFHTGGHHSFSSVTNCRLTSVAMNYGVWNDINCTGNSLLVRAPDSWSKGYEFESQQERRENFVIQSTLCAESHSVSRSTPVLHVLPQWHVKDPGHFAKV